MKIISTYGIKIKHYNKIFNHTVEIYRKAVDFFIGVALNEWDTISIIPGSKLRVNKIEALTIRTKNNTDPEYPFEDYNKAFYKFPSYLRRSAISEALGKVSSYKSNLANWEFDPKGKKPSKPRAGNLYPCLYKDNMYQRNSDYEAKIKVRIRNTWDWLTVSLKKSDVDYIIKHCHSLKECAPSLQKKGREWFLNFPFEEKVSLNTVPIKKQIIAAVDLGVNSACVVSVMKPDGTVIGRKFLKLPRENDCLIHSMNRIKKAQQNGATRTPRLWAKTKGISEDIAVKTANFIVKTAHDYNVNTIIFEHLDFRNKSKAQRLQHWKANRVQSIVTHKAHRLGIRVSRVNAYNTSKLAFDGSGQVKRDAKNYSVCTFTTGKIYNCDLNASYNIGARYFIREILKSSSVKKRLQLVAKVPRVSKRSTCTLSTLISLNAVL